MSELKVEQVGQAIIAFLQKEKIWEGDIGVEYNGVCHTNNGTSPAREREEHKGLVYIWFEGAPYRKFQDDRKFYEKFQGMLEKYGCYFELYFETSGNVYKI
ncbi:hypothetical protein ACQKN7_27460 [Bacillus cereus]|uniref:hypothetical protein n=1 Tax=Bacillus cereus TaxID=1396 RepID=UPI003CFBEB71